MYRIWITKIVFPTDTNNEENKNNDLKALFFGDVGSSIINIIFVLIISQVFAKVFTHNMFFYNHFSELSIYRYIIRSRKF